MIKFFFITVIFVMQLGSLNFVYAQERTNISYYEVYQLCGPAAERIARQQCNYGIVFENFYQECMYKQGYGDDAVIESYDNYMASYNYCSSVANENTKLSCNYGNLYQTQFSKCTRSYGFDETGESINVTPANGSFEFGF